MSFAAGFVNTQMILHFLRRGHFKCLHLARLSLPGELNTQLHFVKQKDRQTMNGPTNQTRCFVCGENSYCLLKNVLTTERLRTLSFNLSVLECIVCGERLHCAHAQFVKCGPPNGGIQTTLQVYCLLIWFGE